MNAPAIGRSLKERVSAGVTFLLKEQWHHLRIVAVAIGVGLAGLSWCWWVASPYARDDLRSFLRISPWVGTYVYERDNVRYEITLGRLGTHSEEIVYKTGAKDRFKISGYYDFSSDRIHLNRQSVLSSGQETSDDFIREVDCIAKSSEGKRALLPRDLRAPFLNLVNSGFGFNPSEANHFACISGPSFPLDILLDPPVDSILKPHVFYPEPLIANVIWADANGKGRINLGEKDGVFEGMLLFGPESENRRVGVNVTSVRKDDSDIECARIDLGDTATVGMLLSSRF